MNNVGYVLSNGNTYIGKKPNGKFIATYEPGIAIVFDTDAKAWNALHQLPRGYQEAGYLPKKTEEQEKTEEQKSLLVSVPELPVRQNLAVSFPIKSSEWLTELKNNMRIVCNTLGTLKKEYARVYGELNDASGEIEDLEHIIEFKDVNAAQRCKLEMELQKARKKRRECKDAMFLIETAMRMESGSWDADKMIEALDRLENRVYTPKVRFDLFEQEEQKE